MQPAFSEYGCLRSGEIGVSATDGAELDRTSWGTGTSCDVWCTELGAKRSDVPSEWG